MIIDTNQQKPECDRVLGEIMAWRKDAKKYQPSLYNLLSDTADFIKRQEKKLNDEGKKTTQGFSINAADIAFSNYIRRRAKFCCERCGKQYANNSNGLQCSHHFSRRYHNIRYDPDNALALCYNCHVFWYQKDIPEAARWLEEKIGKDKIDRLIELKNQPQKKPTQTEIDQIKANIEGWEL